MEQVNSHFSYLSALLFHLEINANSTNSIVILPCVLQSEPIRVLVTGAAGQIAYSLLFSIAKGDVFGKDQVRKKLLSCLAHVTH